MMTEEGIQKIIIKNLVTLLDDFHIETDKEVSSTTIIYGNEGVLDSMGLVSLVADVENEIAEVSGKSITLASEKAMSRSRSPFHTVSTLTDFCLECLTDQ